MSCSAALSLSERIDRIACCRRAEMRFESVPVNHIYRAAEQAGDEFFQADIFVDRPFGSRLEFHQNIDVAVRPVVATRDRTEHGRATDSARPQGGVGIFQCRYDIIAAHAACYQIPALRSSLEGTG